MSKVLLIDPPLYKHPFWDPIRYAQPLGLWSIASHLERFGHETEILCAPVEDWSNQRIIQSATQADGPLFQPYQQFKARFLGANSAAMTRREYGASATESFVYIGLSFAQIAERIEAANPDLIGIALIASCNHQSVIDLVTYLRRSGCDIPIVVGGQHATAMPEQVLRDSQGAINWVVRGEAEQIMLALADNPTDTRASRHLPGTCHLDHEGRFFKNKRPRFFDLGDITLPSAAILDRLPMTATPSHTLDTNGRRYADIMFSVGCHNTCAYCYSPQMRGGLRQYSEDNTRSILEDLWGQGYRELILQDDDLLSDRAGFLKLIGIIKEFGFHWQDNGGIELELLDEALVDAIADSRCTGLYVPVNPRKIADRFPRPEALLKVGLLHRLKSHGIYTYTSGIYGVPNLEAPESTMDDIRALRDFHVDLVAKGYVDASMVFPLAGLPGTKWYFEIQRHPEFAFDAGNWLSYSIYVPQIRPRSVSREAFDAELVEVHRQLNQIQISLPWFSPFPNNRLIEKRGVCHG